MPLASTYAGFYPQLRGTTESLIISVSERSFVWPEGIEMRGYQATTEVDQVEREARERFQSARGVTHVSVRHEDDVPVFTIEGNALSMADIDAIIDIKWDIVDRHPGRYLHIEIHDLCEP